MERADVELEEREETDDNESGISSFVNEWSDESFRAASTTNNSVNKMPVTAGKNTVEKTGNGR